MEIVQLTLSGSVPPEETGGLEGPRLIGRKVTGDPNVPANQVSFTANLMDVQDIESLLDGNAMVVGIPLSGPVVVNLAARSVDTVLDGLGQINRHPGTWAPEWVAASILTYKDRRDKLSVLWRELDAHWQHIMDLEKIYIPHGWDT